MRPNFVTLSLAVAELVQAGVVGQRQPASGTSATAPSSPGAIVLTLTTTSTPVPDYFQTSPEVLPGPTVTGSAPFLAQTNPAPFGNEASFVANAPLETNLPIAGNTNNASIFQLLGQVSSYFPSPGFGSNEYPLPPGANISLVNILHRHGARYPTGTSAVAGFGAKIGNLTSNKTATWTGQLSFLNSWRYSLGAEVLVAQGHKEIFDAGVLFYYNYGALYNTSTKVVVRTTSQDRMLKSAEYFAAGFWGLDWTQNATIEPILEKNGFNNSLSGNYQCKNSQTYVSTGGNNASLIWENIYLANATKRLSAMSGKYNWSIVDAYNAQTMCPYETVAFGYSAWCDLFTYEEWQGFEYSIDLQFQGNNGFASPSGRGVGIGYVEELYARLQGHLYNLPAGATNVNTTLDEMASTFPLNQPLYFDFSHDTNMFSIITALGLTQFAEPLPATGPPVNQTTIISHMTPFGARLVLEVIKAPAPVKAIRPPADNTNANTACYYETGNATTYVHLMLNQATIPLYKSYADCGVRDDGWCEFNTFLSNLSGLLATAQYDYSCFGDYPSPPYVSDLPDEVAGTITNGVPPTLVKRHFGGETGPRLEV